jgi:hypothetical protein
MATRVVESAVLNAPLDDVWRLVRTLDFGFSSAVVKSENENGALSDQVGSVVKLTFKDGTSQRLRRLELSELDHFVSWELLESIPEVSYLSTVSSISLKSITSTNQTFIQWQSDFSSDAGPQVIQDAKFKRLDAFKDLSVALHSSPSAA